MHSSHLGCGAKLPNLEGGISISIKELCVFHVFVLTNQMHRTYFQSICDLELN
jgi:hypothetical protein